MKFLYLTKYNKNTVQCYSFYHSKQFPQHSKMSLIVIDGDAQTSFPCFAVPATAQEASH